MYSQDFAPAETVFQPVSEGLVLGLSPLLLGLLALLLVAAGLLGCGWGGGRDARRTAAQPHYGRRSMPPSDLP